jgi:hypothetical protein
MAARPVPPTAECGGTSRLPVKRTDSRRNYKICKRNCKFEKLQLKLEKMIQKLKFQINETVYLAESPAVHPAVLYIKKV